MSRNKGKRGEREVINWLQPIVDRELQIARNAPSQYMCNKLPKAILLQRNTVQSDCGGSDIIGLDWMGAEVKWVEAQGPGALEDWWQQCKEQAEAWPRVSGEPRIPILFYKGKARWRVRLMGWAGEDAGGIPCLVEIEAAVFEAWIVARLHWEWRKAAGRA